MPIACRPDHAARVLADLTHSAGHVVEVTYVLSLGYIHDGKFKLTTLVSGQEGNCIPVSQFLDRHLGTKF